MVRGFADTLELFGKQKTVSATDDRWHNLPFRVRRESLAPHPLSVISPTLLYSRVARLLKLPSARLVGVFAPIAGQTPWGDGAGVRPAKSRNASAASAVTWRPIRIDLD
jgi:hypothetical protein